MAKVLVLNCFAADPLRRSWSKRPSIAFWRDPVQPPFSGTWSPRQFRTSPPPAWRIWRVFAATRAKRKMKPSGPPCRGNKKASRFPSWPAWPVRWSDLGQSRAVAQQLAREGPALRDVQATQKVSPRLGVVRWHRRVPRRSRTIKGEADEERMAMKRLRTTWTSQMHLATRSGSTESFVRMTESRGELDAK